MPSMLSKGGIGTVGFRHASSGVFSGFCGMTGYGFALPLYTAAVDTSGSTFIGLALGGQFIYSTDNGWKWTTGSTGGYQQYRGLAYGNGYWVACGLQAQAYGYYLTTAGPTPSGSWTGGLLNAGNNLSFQAYPYYDTTGGWFLLIEGPSFSYFILNGAASGSAPTFASGLTSMGTGFRGIGGNGTAFKHPTYGWVAPGRQTGGSNTQQYFCVTVTPAYNTWSTSGTYVQWTSTYGGTAWRFLDISGSAYNPTNDVIVVVGSGYINGQAPTLTYCIGNPAVQANWVTPSNPLSAYITTGIFNNVIYDTRRNIFVLIGNIYSAATNGFLLPFTSTSSDGITWSAPTYFGTPQNKTSHTGAMYAAVSNSRGNMIAFGNAWVSGAQISSFATLKT